MAKRIKSDKPALLAISNWENADESMRQIGDLQLKINQAEARAKDDIDEIKADLVEEVKPLQESINVHNRSLEAFAIARPEDFGKNRSRRLNFGVLGWRKSTSIKITKNTLELIRKIFSRTRAKALIRIKEAVDKDALAKLTDEELAGIKARRESKDVFFVEPDVPEAVDYCD